MMTANELTEAGWLLAYEAASKGWLPATHLAQDQDFMALHNANVSFYQVIAQPQQATITLPGSAGAVASVI